MRGLAVALACVVLPGLVAAQEPYTAKFAIEGADSDGARYQGTLEVRGAEVRRRVRVGDQWLEHSGRGTARDDGSVLRLVAEVTGPGGAGLADALLDGRAAPGGAGSLVVSVWRGEGRVEARLTRPGYAAEDRGQLEAARFDLRREVRSNLPADARLHMEVAVDAGPTRLREDVVLRHQEAGGEVRRTFERLRVGDDPVDVSGIVERLRRGATWESGLELLERAGGERAARKRLEGTFASKSLQCDAPAELLLSARPVAVGETWSLDPRALRAFYKVERLDHERSRASARLVSVEDSSDGPRYRVSARVELAVLAIQGVELQEGSTLEFTHELTQSRTRHEIVSVGRLQGRMRSGAALDQRMNTRFQVLSLVP